MPKIVGIDASLTNTGIVILTKLYGIDEPVCKSFVLTSQFTGARRLIDLRNQVATCLVGADLVVIEGYAYSRATQAHQLGELGGVLRVMFQEAGLSWIEAGPHQLKKFATGAGNAPKELILQQVLKRFGAEFCTSHEADAYALARIGYAYLGHMAGLTALQLGVVEEIRNGRARKARKKKPA